MGKIDFDPVLVLDMQPIDPPIGGGRIRLLGLYHELGCYLDVTYLGTYDWPNEKYRNHMLSATLKEINIPLSNAHHDAAQKLFNELGGKTVIDSVFHKQAYLSPEFVNEANSLCKASKIVVFSHPWIYPLVEGNLDKEQQLIVYDSQNVEGYLRKALLDDNNLGTVIADEVARIEKELCLNSDLILACSHSDRQLFHNLYNIPYSKIRIVPNGVFTKRIQVPTQLQKEECRVELGLSNRFTAIFLASAYEPNIDAANHICEEIAPLNREIDIIIAGGVGNTVDVAKLKDNGIKNIKIVGNLDEDLKRKYLWACDCAINPMFAGSGTNIKMFDYFAAGLPTVTTEIGARGIIKTGESAFIVVEGTEFSNAIRELAGDKDKGLKLSGNARKLVEEHYSLERISKDLGILLRRQYDCKKSKRPLYSVIVPSFKRHSMLDELVRRLEMQTTKDFEVIVVDQSPEPWNYKEQDYSIDLLYIHTDIIGAVNARNIGGKYARGEIIAFTDDDCQPHCDWLEKAAIYFKDCEVVGLEGLITSEHRDDREYRSVSNENFYGIGFMTANLFIRREIFDAINGFDLIFDKPHFREDTDLGWRALEKGKIPFAKEVIVFHPPHKRIDERESMESRVQYFEKDPLLMSRHPERYKQLFHCEAHWQNTEGFWENFLYGTNKYQTDLPDYYLQYIKQWLLRKYCLKK